MNEKVNKLIGDVGAALMTSKMPALREFGSKLAVESNTTGMKNALEKLSSDFNFAGMRATVSGSISETALAHSMTRAETILKCATQLGYETAGKAPDEIEGEVLNLLTLRMLAKEVAPAKQDPNEIL